MVNQVIVIAILMLVNGTLQVLMGLYLALIGPFMRTIIRANPQPMGQQEEEFLTMLSAGLLIFGIVVLVVGALNVLGGIQALRFRSRGFVLFALFTNVLAFFTGYCLPTSLGVMVYGLVVVFQSDVAQAFQMGQSGMPANDIRERFVLARYRGPRDMDDRLDRYDERERAATPSLPPPPDAPLDEGFKEGRPT